MKTTDFLIEFQTEELPAGYIEPALSQFEEKYRQLFEENRISCKEIKGLGVPRRLVIFIRESEVLQRPERIEIIGPPKKVAFDTDGKPTKQTMGFLRRNGRTLKDLKVKSTERGDYVYCLKKMESRSTKALLKNSFLDLIRGIKLPKTMRWDESKITFARPIRKISIVEGAEVSEYFNWIKKSSIILDPSLRKARIKKQLELHAQQIGAEPYLDEALLNEATYMVECPSVFLGQFNKEYLLLPKEVLIASMFKYQRVFGVTKNGRLLPNFIAVIDGKKKAIHKIKSNYEGVLNARLKDSLFFFREDSKEKLFNKKEQLKELIFHKDLGNMYEKIFRIKELALFLAKKLGFKSEKIPLIERAALLSKVDLVTQMVKEFPSLQGIMGREYALRDGEEKEIAWAISEHYLPSVVDGPLPKTELGTIIAISDRLDSLVGFLGVGMKATGSYDPYGIRRIAQSIIRIIVEKDIHLSLNEILENSIELLKGYIKIEKDRFRAILLEYLKERIENLIDPGNLAPVGLKEGVLCIGFDDPVDAFNRFKALLKISKQESFLKAAKVVERTSNILKGAKKETGIVKEVNPALFVEDLEKALWLSYLESKDRIGQFIKEKKYIEATRLYGEAFYKIIHEFFDKVLVNVQEQSLRLNRLAIMKVINSLYTEKVADLAKLPQIVM